MTRRAVFERLARLQGGGKPLSPQRNRRRTATRDTPEPATLHGERISRRLLLLGVGQLALYGLLATKLTRLQKIEGRRYESLAEENRLAQRFRPAVRGRIYDRHGTLVATNQDNLRVLVVPEDTGDVAVSLARLGEVVAVSAPDRQRVLALAPKQNAQLPILVRGDLSWGEFARINVLGPRLPGIVTDIAWKRRYPFGEDMAHIVGHLGQPDRLRLAAEPALRSTDTRVGVSGIEQGYDEVLRGRPGHEQIEVDARGRNVRSLERAEPHPGRDLHLTIDRELQHRVMQRLAEFRRAALVAMDVRNGEILAMCSTPTFDANLLSDPISREEWQALVEADDDPMSDKATRGQYPPGSTFKMVTALAGLEAGIITPKSRFTCHGAIERAGHKFRCWKRNGHGRVDLYRGIKQSCDVYFYETADRVGIRRIADMAHLLGLGQTYDCGLPGQKPGLIPDPDWKKQEQRRGWFDGETLIAGIGQGYVLTTPLQLAVMTARIASGRRIDPRLVLPGAGENTIGSTRLPIREASLELVRRAMTGVVNDADGTAVRAALGMPGVLMAGKTGTAQVHGNRGLKPGEIPWKLRDHALFVAFAPASEPRYALSVVIEHGESGGAVAAPVAADVMKMLLQREENLRLSELAAANAADGRNDASGGERD